MRHLGKECGVSLVTVLVALALLGVMATIVEKFVSNNFKVLGTQQDGKTLEDLRRYVRIGMACPKVPPQGPAWVLNSEIAIPKRGGGTQALINKSSTGSTGYTKVGSQCLRAVVTAVVTPTTPIKEFNVEYSPDCLTWKSLSYLKIQCP